MYNTYFVLATTAIKTRTHIDRTPLEQFISDLPFMVLIVGIFVFAFYSLRLAIKDDQVSDQISEPDTASGKMLYNSLQQTKSYYKNNRIQMAIIFVCAIISCFVGLTVLMISIFYFNDKAQTMGIISGTVVSFISGSFFWIYKQCNNQVQHYFNELIKIQNIFIAMELIEECNEKTKNQNITKIIDKLINTSDVETSSNNKSE
jgi:hypothetical protein